MPVKITPEEFANKHAKRLKAAIEDMRIGVERVTESPALAAIAKQEKMKQKLIESIDSGKWAGGLKKVTLEEWRSKMLTKGLPRVSGGIDAAHDKVVDFASQLLPAVDAASKKVQAMPDLTLEDNIARMTTFVRDMSKFKKK